VEDKFYKWKIRLAVSNIETLISAGNSPDSLIPRHLFDSFGFNQPV
jgi:hypothetical protein